LTDAVIGFVESNGRFFIMDMWTTGYLQPILESSQDLSNMEGVVEDGFTTLKFTRPRNTNDNQDIAFTDDKGQFLGASLIIHSFIEHVNYKIVLKVAENGNLVIYPKERI
jgi:hypothetical protein